MNPTILGIVGEGLSSRRVCRCNLHMGLLFPSHNSLRLLTTNVGMIKLRWQKVKLSQLLNYIGGVVDDPLQNSEKVMC